MELKATDCIVAWPVITGIDLATLFDAYDEFAGDVKTSVEWWIGNEFFERSLSHRQEIKSAALDLREKEKRRGSPLDLVQLVCADLVFEVTFGGVETPAPATRLAVVVTSVTPVKSRTCRDFPAATHPTAPSSAVRARALGLKLPFGRRR